MRHDGDGILGAAKARHDQWYGARLFGDGGDIARLDRLGRLALDNLVAADHGDERAFGHGAKTGLSWHNRAWRE